MTSGTTYVGIFIKDANVEFANMDGRFGIPSANMLPRQVDKKIFNDDDDDKYV